MHTEYSPRNIQRNNAIFHSSNQDKGHQGNTPTECCLGKTVNVKYKIKSHPRQYIYRKKKKSYCKTDNNISARSILMLSIHFLIVSSFPLQLPPSDYITLLEKQILKYCWYLVIKNFRNKIIPNLWVLLLQIISETIISEWNNRRWRGLKRA